MMQYRIVPLFLVLMVLSAMGVSAGDKKPLAGEKGVLIDEPVFRSRFYVQEAGTGNPLNLVLCHGTGELGAKIWDPLLPKLAERFHVYAFDLPGFARSEKKNKLYSPENYARFIKWFIDTYVKGPVYLVGHSMGGAISLYFAGAYPDSLEKLVLVDAAGILHRAAFTKNALSGQITGTLKVGGLDLLKRPINRFKYLMNTTIEKLDNNLMPEDLAPALEKPIFRKTALNGDPIRISGMAMIHTDFSRIIHTLKVPTVIIWGQNDVIAPVRTAKLLAFTVDDTYLRIMPGLGHSPMIEAPELFLDRLFEYVSPRPSHRFEKTESRRPNLPMRDEEIFEGKQDLIVQGNYKSLELIDCEDVTLRRVFSHDIRIENSRVFIENSAVDSQGIGLNVVDSIVQLTGVSITGKIAIKTSNSKLDIAGSLLRGNRVSIQSEWESTVVFSVSRLISAANDEYTHRIIMLNKGEVY